MLSSDLIRGYIEGYYGKLLAWPDRDQIVSHLAALGMNAYLYAPKEDPAHRLHWRQPWDHAWVTSFRAFCDHAHANHVRVFAGIAPGLDFDFASPDADLMHLRAKAAQLQSCGADTIVLMFDDIEPPAGQFPIGGNSEAHCHAAIANQLAAEYTVQLVPRIYADEIAPEDAARAYYQDLSAQLDAAIELFHCGSRIVGSDFDAPATTGILSEYFNTQPIWWDNIYCNDYCPRRLFLGPHGGGGGAIMLNGTGLPHTDQILLSLFNTRGDHPQGSPTTPQSERPPQATHAQILQAANVPAAFQQIACYFDHPVFSGEIPADLPGPTDRQMAAIETLLWQWKTPLAREWYPYLFGLKHDALLYRGELPDERIAKTQLSPLYDVVRHAR